MRKGIYLLLLPIVFLLGWFSHSSIDTRSISSEFGYLDEVIYKKCPYYVPDGVTFRDCLADLVNGETDTVQKTFTKLINDLSDPKNQTIESSYMYDDLVKKLKQLNPLWLAYRDSYCEAMNLTSGNGYSEFVNECKLYLTHEYVNDVNDVKSGWISNSR